MPTQPLRYVKRGKAIILELERQEEAYRSGHFRLFAKFVCSEGSIQTPIRPRIRLLPI